MILFVNLLHIMRWHLKCLLYTVAYWKLERGSEFSEYKFHFDL